MFSRVHRPLDYLMREEYKFKISDKVLHAFTLILWIMYAKFQKIPYGQNQNTKFADFI